MACSCLARPTKVRLGGRENIQPVTSQLLSEIRQRTASSDAGYLVRQDSRDLSVPKQESFLKLVVGIESLGKPIAGQRYARFAGFSPWKQVYNCDLDEKR